MKLSNQQLQQLSQGEWVVAVSNAFYWHPEYIFALAIKGFQWLLGRKKWKFQHTVRFVNGQVIEMNAKGKNTPTVGEWVVKRRRKIALFQYEREFCEVAALPYGFLDILQISLHHIRKALKIGHSWNGTSGVPKKWDGHFCVEETLKACRDPKAHQRLPCELFELPYLTYIGTYET